MMCFTYYYLKYDLKRADMSGPLAQSAERGADNAKVVSSSLTRTIPSSVFFFIISCVYAKTY